MKIKRLIGGNLESNGYIIYDQPQGSCYIIDPGYQGGRFLDEMKKLELSLLGILLTHHHYDHVGGVDKIKTATGCSVYLHRQDCDAYQKPVEEMLEDGQLLMLGEEEIRVIHTPGHTEGSVCFYSEQSKLSFTGDTIFNVDLGRTDLSDGSPEQMAHSIREVISHWPNEITIYPGHGDSCNMKYVRSHNQEFLDLIKE